MRTVKTAGYYLLAAGAIIFGLPNILTKIGAGYTAQNYPALRLGLSLIAFALAGWFMAKPDNASKDIRERLKMSAITVFAGVLATVALSIGAVALWIIIRSVTDGMRYNVMDAFDTKFP